VKIVSHLVFSFKNPLLEKVEEKGAYGGFAPVENKILAPPFPKVG